MSVTVTIHEGELKQIKNLIDNEEKGGQLYGLWTHSNQPVIQYVIGDPKPKESEQIKKCLQESHGLRHIGNWSAVGRGKESKIIIIAPELSTSTFPTPHDCCFFPRVLLSNNTFATPYKKNIHIRYSRESFNVIWEMWPAQKRVL